MKRLQRRHVVGLGLLTLAALVTVWLFSSSSPKAPRPDDTDLADVLVRGLVHQGASIVDRRPNHAPSWLQLARVYHANDFPQLAEPCYEQAIRLNPKDPQATYGLALLLHRQGRVDEALVQLQRVLKLDDSYSPALWRRGRWYLEAGRVEDAVADFEKAGRRQPDPDRAIMLAELARHQGDMAEVVRILEPHLQRFPRHAVAHRYLGEAYQRLGRPEDALIPLARGRHANHVLKDPWRAEIDKLETGLEKKTEQAAGYFMQGNMPKAIEYSENLTRDYPDHARAAANLALVYATVGRFDEAHSVLDEAVSRVAGASEQAIIHFGRESVFEEQHRFTNALNEIDQAIALHPKSGKYLITKASLLARLERREQAIAVLDKAAKVLVRNGEALRTKGELELALGRSEDALQSFETAVQRDPLQIQAWVAIAELRATRGDLDGADGALGVARRIDATAPRLIAAEQTIDRLRREKDRS